LPQFRCPGSRPFPLTPQDAAHLAPQPAIEVLERALHLGQPEVGDPTAQDGDEVFDGVGHGASTPLAERRPELVPQPLDTARRHSQARLPACR
jgi:hypothetical protein